MGGHQIPAMFEGHWDLAVPFWPWIPSFNPEMAPERQKSAGIFEIKKKLSLRVVEIIDKAEESP